MQAEILAANPASKIRILGVNDAGLEEGNELAVQDRTIPLLQDTTAAGVWVSWNVQWRDLVILDGEGKALGVFSLFDHDLSFRPEYDTILDYLRLKAGE